QGGTLNCQGFPCKQKIVSFTRHRRLAGRDPTARRWSPKAKSRMPLRRAAFPGFSSCIFMHFMVKLFFLSCKSCPSLLNLLVAAMPR
ncbi:MAG: hypothetical protein WCI51_07875, partial [Lentisphaerota bacterium]